MSNDDYRIPRFGGAGVAFLGVELNDTYILIASVFVALFAGNMFGTIAYILVPILGYFLNTLYIDWRSKSPPGELKAKMFSLGLSAYNMKITSKKVLVIGDSDVANPGNSNLLDKIIQELEDR